MISKPTASPPIRLFLLFINAGVELEQHFDIDAFPCYHARDSALRPF